jgi:hypothetical protein
VKRLARTWYATDAGAPLNGPGADTEYVGAFSTPIPDHVIERIVSVDWSVRGEVEVTYWVAE